MVYTKEQFKRLWESDAYGGGITFDDVADCAVEWRLYRKPKCCDIYKVLYDVCKHANVKESEMPSF
jgi:hypothetical protein